MSTLLSIVGWVVAAVVLAGALVGASTLLARWCGHVVVAVAQLLLPWLVVGSFVVLVVGVAARQWWLVVVAGVAVSLGVVVIAPHLRSRRPEPPEGDGPTFTVALANLYLDNPEPDEAIEQLLDLAPDVLVMTELTDELVARFDRLGGAASYPHRVHPEPIEGEYVPGVFTRQAIRDARVDGHGALRTVEATLDAPTAPVRVVVVHPDAPSTRDGFRRWRRQLRELRRLIDAADGPTIVLGDLNAGTLQAPYEDLLRSTFRDAHLERGRALVPSWGIAPWMPRWVPTFVARLDHLLVSPDVQVVELEDLDAVGSDHRPFSATLTVAEG